MKLPIISYLDVKFSEVNRLSVLFGRLVLKKKCFSAWASTLNMGLINKGCMVCLSPVGYGV